MHRHGSDAQRGHVVVAPAAYRSSLYCQRLIQRGVSCRRLGSRHGPRRKAEPVASDRLVGRYCFRRPAGKLLDRRRDLSVRPLIAGPKTIAARYEELVGPAVGGTGLEYPDPAPSTESGAIFVGHPGNAPNPYLSRRQRSRRGMSRLRPISVRRYSTCGGTTSKSVTTPVCSEMCEGQPPPRAVSKIGQPISVFHLDSSSVSWGPTK